MPITPAYPGVYVEELPSVSHSVTPAPTSVTAFVGYTHPLKTQTFNQAVQLSSFADYQANFGGFFSHPLLPDYVGQAVSQFFLNGGSTAWVVGLASNYFAIPTTAGTAPAGTGRGGERDGDGRGQDQRPARVHRSGTHRADRYQRRHPDDADVQQPAADG